MRIEGDEDENLFDVEPVDEVETPEVEEEVEQAEEGQIVVSLGEEEPEEEDGGSEAFKRLRQHTREQAKRIKQQEAELRELQKAKEVEKEVILGKRPELHDDGIDYDGDKFAEKLLEWNARKAEVEAKQRAEREKQEAIERDFQSKVEQYNTAKQSIGVPDYEDAEELAMSTLSKIQQGIIVAHADKPELVIYALGKNQKEAERLAAIADPIRFALAIRDLEKEKLKVSRKPSTAPEKEVTRSASPSASVDKHLDKLEAEADRTGDRSKVIAYKKSLRNK